MKKISMFITLSLIFFGATAQNVIDTSKQPIHYKDAAIEGKNLVRFIVPLKKTTHIISPEPILYADISSSDVQGDLPEKNIFRMRPSSGMHAGDNFQVTIVTGSFVEVYDMIVSDSDNSDKDAFVITIDPSDAVQTNPYDEVTQQDFSKLSMTALTKRKEIGGLIAKQYGMLLTVNNIFIVGDFLLFDITCINNTRLSYNVDDIRFKLQDKKKVNAHVSQEIELKPVYQFYNTQDATIKNKWRNLYLFRKFTYPGEKVLNIELTEKQISGRKVDLNVDYKKVLRADYLSY
jgi:conjugative transposon TraN protein